MNTHQQIAADVRRRAALLPREVAEWKRMTEENIDGMGIHRSQIAAVNVLLEELPKSQDEVVADLDPALEPKIFAQRRSDAEQALVAAHGIVAIFRFILAQRADELYRKPLDAADLIAAACYKPCVDLAVTWEAITEDQLREPPLTYLSAIESAVALTREHKLSLLNAPLAADLLPLADDESPLLPISVISLPFSHTVAPWTYCSIHHEVGHPLDREFDLTEALSPPLMQRLEADGVPEKRIQLWQRWLREVIADAFGVLLGGAGFALSMTSTLLQPERDVVKINVGDDHPTPYARMFLLGALMRRLEMPPLNDIADEIEQLWNTIYGEPPDPLPFREDCPAVAEIVLETALPMLQGKRLRDFAPDPAGDFAVIDTLAFFLRTGFDRPEPNDVSYRLMPAAAQLAVWQTSEDHAAALEKIQQRTDTFLHEKQPPEFLDAPESMSAAREEHLRGLVRKLDLRTMRTE